MSNIDLRYRNAIGSLKLIAESGALALDKQELAFLTGEKLWVSNERELARKCIEAVVYGGLDVLGMPRLKVPAEFVAVAIAMFVHPNNMRTACMFFEGVSSVENMINDVEMPLSPHQLFAFVIQILGGDLISVDSQQKFLDKKAQLLGV